MQDQDRSLIWLTVFGFLIGLGKLLASDEA